MSAVIVFLALATLFLVSIGLLCVLQERDEWGQSTRERLDEDFRRHHGGES